MGVLSLNLSSRTFHNPTPLSLFRFACLLFSLKKLEVWIIKLIIYSYNFFNTTALVHFYGRLLWLFISQFWLFFFLRIAWYKLTIASYKVIIAWYKLAIVCYKVRIVEKKSEFRSSDFISQNCKFISHNYDFLTRNYEFVSCNYEKKVRIVRKSQLPFLFFIQWRKRASIHFC